MKTYQSVIQASVGDVKAAPYTLLQMHV